MKLNIAADCEMLGLNAAVEAAKDINEAIEKQGYARIVLSTGSSQFETLKNLIKQDVDWSKVDMFHLDEYVGISESHIASFRKYLKEKFVSQIPLKKAHFVSGEGDIFENIKILTKELTEKPIDLGLIGIGENSHIAFNDPPADFDTRESYIVVNLDERCKMQQVGEGWFKTLDDVPKQAISMTPYRIMQCRKIITCAPHAVKADAIQKTLETKEVTNLVPATLLRTHADWSLFIDESSASKLSKETTEKY